MPYQLSLTNGDVFANVPDGGTETASTSLTLIGKNFAGYGAFLNENFVKLLENFANGSAPTNPLQGQIWWDTTNKVLKVLSGTTWKTVSSSTSSPTVPSNPSIGDLWWDTANGQLKVYGGSTWVVVGPAYTATQGQTGVIADVVSETGGAQSHIIVKVYVNNSVIAVLSKDTSFSVSSLAGFSIINPGFNLATGTGTAYGYYGDANNAVNLGGIPAANYLRADQATSTNYPFAVRNNGGLTVGQGNDFEINVQTNAVNLLSNIAGKDLNMYVNVGGLATKLLTLNGTSGAITVPADPTALLGVATKQYVDNTLAGTSSLVLKRDGSNTINGIIVPATNGTVNFGSASQMFNNIYATNFVGLASDSTKLNNVAAGSYARTDINASFLANVNVGGANDFTINSTASPNSVNLKGNTNNKNLTISVNVGGVPTNAITIAGTSGLVTVIDTPTGVGTPGTTIATKNYVDTKVSGGGSSIALGSINADIIPSVTNTYNIGSSATKWLNVYSTTFTGNLTGAATTAGTVTGAAQTAITSVGTLSSLNVTGALSSGALTASSMTDPGNLTFTGVGNRIIGDFSNATYANRVMFQSSIAGGATSVGAIPNGVATLSGFVAYNNSSPANASVGILSVDNTACYIESGATGSAVNLPLILKTGGATRFQVGTAGELGIGGATYGTSGYVLTSQGSGTPPTWSPAAVGAAGQSAGSASTGFVNYNGTSSTAGQFDGGTTAPTGTTRLNYNGYLFANRFSGDGSTLTNLTWANITGRPTLVSQLTNDSAFITAAGTAAAFSSTSLNSQFNSIGVGVAGSAVAGEIRATNNVTAYYSSDIRLKENVTPIANAVDKVNQLSGNEFDWTQAYIEARGGIDGYFVRKHDVGVIAQEVEAVLPEAVADRDDGYKGVNYEKLVPLLIQAVKELSAEVALLKAGK